MRWYRKIVRAAIFLPVVALVSCIDGREEVWLNSDGSGKIELEYAIPPAAVKIFGDERKLENWLDGFLKRNHSIRDSSHSITTVDERLIIEIRASFDSVIELQKSANPAEGDKPPGAVLGFLGDFKVASKGRRISFQRTLDVKSALPGASFFSAEKFRDHFLEYIVHLPIAADSSNAQIIGDHGKSLHWKVPMGNAIRGPFALTFEATAPFPRWVLAAALAGFAFLAFFVFKIARSGRAVRITSPAA